MWHGALQLRQGWTWSAPRQIGCSGHDSNPHQDAADVAALGIRQTPTFFLNGRLLDDVSFDSLLANVAAAVEGPP